MLSFKRKRQELGKDTGFIYRGHLFEQERLERASKRRKGPLMSSPVLPPYITALVSPRESPQMTGSLPAHLQTSALPDSTEESTRNSGMPNSLDFLSNNFFHQSEDSGSKDALNSLDVFSDPLFLHDGRQGQADSGLQDSLQDNSIALFSPRCRSILPTSSGGGIQITCTENPSPLMPQITSTPPYVPAEQSANDDDFPLPDLNLDLDFSMFLNSPHRPSTAPSSSHSEPHLRGSVEKMSISPLQLTDRDDNHGGNILSNPVSEIASVADQALDPVTGDDLAAESIAPLLFLLKSLIFPHYDTATQKYHYENSVLSGVFCPRWCEWLCFEFEGLLDLYLEGSLRSIRKRRTARTIGSLPSRRNSKLNERRQNFELSDRTQRLSIPTQTTVITKLRRTLFRRCSTPMGTVVFEVREGPSSLIDDERQDSSYQIIVSFMPWTTERTTGVRARLSRMMGGPAISPQINTFNVIPDDSAIIQCVCKNDLRGIQTLFDLGAASARDVDSRGRSLINYAMYTGCSDVFRFLVQGGASINEVEYFGDRTTDVITAVWDMHALSNSGAFIDFAGLSLEKLKSFEQCVAITQLALDNNCTINSAHERVIHANPLFSLIGYLADAHASAVVHAIDYLYSIGWDLEEKNCLGQTPLLYAAGRCHQSTVSCLRALIERGARVDARDKTGQGPLHSALSPPFGLSDWIDLKCIYREEGVLDNNWALNQFFNTEDREHARDYVYCVDEWGDGHWIRNPSHVLKDRVRTKLKVLLEAGCDPNDLDDNGDSPSDYARHGLWSQWLWALGMTGYVFDEERSRWIKQTETA